MVSKASPLLSSAASLSPRYTGGSHLSPCRLRDASFKTEFWREKGEVRWPVAAADEARKNPTQFARGEDPMVPLQRTNTNHQRHIGGELWTRSLRARSLTIDRIGLHNQNVSTAAVSVMFDGRGAGFSGRTNLGRAKKTDSNGYGSHIKNWVERPVAVGRYASEHMSGSRYALDLFPRDCVPGSMEHRQKPER
mmetsp:Transcript_60799/g.161502  ORF Transcript_60799/g.161502 Transcript_60799/m.161502 type:complete len:193 (-) Transcript_60799:192-770(-)